MNARHVVPALDKAVSVLEYLGRSEPGVSQADLAKALGIAPSTCYRILQTLLARNWVRQKPGGLYDLSDGLLAPAMKLLDRPRRFECLQPILEQLSQTTGLSCKLSVRQADEQVTVLRAESPAPMAVSGKVGARFPVVEGATGAALLLAEPPENVHRLILECPEEVEERANPEIVDRRLERLKTDGFCMNMRPNRWNVEALAVPLMTTEGRVLAAVTVLGFASDFADGQDHKIAAALRGACEQCHNLI